MMLDLTPAEMVTLEMVLNSYRHRCVAQLRGSAPPLTPEIRAAISGEEQRAFSILTKMGVAK